MTEKTISDISGGISLVIVWLLMLSIITAIPLTFSVKIGTILICLLATLSCLFFWTEWGKENVKFWVGLGVFGVAWTFIGFFIGSLIYRIPYLKILSFDSRVWDDFGYLGPLAVGPFMGILGILSLLRHSVAKLIEKVSSQ